MKRSVASKKPPVFHPLSAHCSFSALCGLPVLWPDSHSEQSAPSVGVLPCVLPTPPVCEACPASGAHVHCCLSERVFGPPLWPRGPSHQLPMLALACGPGASPPRRHVTSLPALPAFHPAPAARGRNCFSRRLVSFREDQSLCEPSHLQYNGAFFLTRRYCLSINNNVSDTF